MRCITLLYLMGCHVVLGQQGTRVFPAIRRVEIHERKHYPVSGDKVKTAKLAELVKRVWKSQRRQQEDEDNTRDVSQEYSQEDFHGSSDNREDGEEGGGDVHIYLKSLLDPEVLSYIVEELPWDEWLGRNKLSRTEEVRYITEHLVEDKDENGGYSHSGIEESKAFNKGWNDIVGNRDRFQQKTRANENKALRSFGGQRRRASYVLRFRDCPVYYSETFGPHASYRTRTSIRRHVRNCRREKRRSRGSSAREVPLDERESVRYGQRIRTSPKPLRKNLTPLYRRPPRRKFKRNLKNKKRKIRLNNTRIRKESFYY